ncbi:hypothetical protein AB0871_28330, partial [Micromonospora marina]
TSSGTDLPGPDASSGTNLAGPDVSAGTDLPGPDLSSGPSGGPDLQSNLASPSDGSLGPGPGPFTGPPTTGASIGASGFPQAGAGPDGFGLSGPAASDVGSHGLDGLSTSGGPLVTGGLALPGSGPSGTRRAGAGLGPLGSDPTKLPAGADFLGTDGDDSSSGLIGRPAGVGAPSGAAQISGLPAGADRTGFLSTGIPDLDDLPASGLSGGQDIGNLAGGTLTPGADAWRSTAGASDPFGLNGPASAGADLAGLGPASGGSDIGGLNSGTDGRNLPSTSGSGLDPSGLRGATGLDIGGLNAAGGTLAGAGAAGAGAAAGANTMGGMPPFMPPMGGAGGQNGQEKRERSTWLEGDPDDWGTDPDCVPAVLGRDGSDAELETQVTWEPTVTAATPASTRPVRESADDRTVRRGH